MPVTSRLTCLSVCPPPGGVAPAPSAPHPQRMWRGLALVCEALPAPLRTGQISLQDQRLERGGGHTQCPSGDGTCLLSAHGTDGFVRSFPGCSPTLSPRIRDIAKTYFLWGHLPHEAQAGVDEGKGMSPLYPAAPLPPPLQAGGPSWPLASGPRLSPPRPLRRAASCTLSPRAVEKLGSALVSRRPWELPLISFPPSPCRW